MRQRCGGIKGLDNCAAGFVPSRPRAPGKRRDLLRTRPPRLFDAVDALTDGYPYALRILNPAAAFYPNMSVRRMVIRHGPPPEALAESPGFEDWRSYRLLRTLPRVYTQDVVVIASPEEAFSELLTGDLRRAAYLEDSNQLSVISNQDKGKDGRVTDYGLLITDYSSFVPGEDSDERFDRLQELNQIRDVAIPSPNRMIVEAEIRRPALLVTTDVYHPGWAVRVDGERREQLQVNYLQRAVPVRPGDRIVEWSFRPAPVRWGFVLFAFGLALLAAIIIRLRRVRPGKYEPDY